MGAVHAHAWQKLGVTVVGIHSKQITEAAAIAERVHAKTFESVPALLEEIDLLDICTPTGTHLEYTRLAASAGKHVVCEKPISLTLRDARTMIEACEAANVRLFIAHVVRFFPQYRAAWDAVERGQIGSLGVLRLKRAAYQPRVPKDHWFLDEAQSGGMVTDLMIHDFDYARWIGGDVTRVYARSARAIWQDAPGDYALVTLRFKSGAIALLEGSWTYPQGIFRTALDIAGSEGVIEWASDRSAPIQHFLERNPDPSSAVGLPLEAQGEDPYEIQLRHVKHALETSTAFLVTPADALEALRIALAARQSLVTGRAVELLEVRE
jgi:myo-inositol 2-dehydrogenase / D-chiro-inositol 1-dehydrogenase